MLTTITTSDGAEPFHEDRGPRNAQPVVHHGLPLSPALKAIELPQDGMLKTYSTFSHGVMPVNADALNADLPAFVTSRRPKGAAND